MVGPPIDSRTMQSNEDIDHTIQSPSIPYAPHSSSHLRMNQESSKTRYMEPCVKESEESRAGLIVNAPFRSQPPILSLSSSGCRSVVNIPTAVPASLIQADIDVSHPIDLYRSKNTQPAGFCPRRSNRNTRSESSESTDALPKAIPTEAEASSGIEQEESHVDEQEQKQERSGNAIYREHTQPERRRSSRINGTRKAEEVDTSMCDPPPSPLIHRENVEVRGAKRRRVAKDGKENASLALGGSPVVQEEKTSTGHAPIQNIEVTTLFTRPPLKPTPPILPPPDGHPIGLPPRFRRAYIAATESGRTAPHEGLSTYTAKNIIRYSATDATENIANPGGTRLQPTVMEILPRMRIRGGKIPLYRPRKTS